MTTQTLTQHNTQSSLEDLPFSLLALEASLVVSHPVVNQRENLWVTDTSDESFNRLIELCLKLC